MVCGIYQLSKAMEGRVPSTRLLFTLGPASVRTLVNTTPDAPSNSPKSSQNARFSTEMDFPGGHSFKENLGQL